MAHHNTVFSQLLQPVPRHEGRKLCKMTLAHQSGTGLRDVVSNFSAHAVRLPKDSSLVIERHPVLKDKGLTGAKSKECPILWRRIGYRDSETGKHYLFLTNSFKLAASTLAEIYKARWQIKLFFKWIKQNLKIRIFLKTKACLGTSKNAVMTRLWIAAGVYLLLTYLKFISQIGSYLPQMLRLLQLNLFEQRSLHSDESCWVALKTTISKLLTLC